MRTLQRLGALIVVAFALSAIGAANASAAQFTASATGFLSGKAVLIQIFTTNGNQVKCFTAASSGTIKSVASEEQTVEVKYSGCTAFGFVNTHITTAFFNLTANGTVHIENTITITPTGAGCTQTYPPQTRGLVMFYNSANGYRADFHLSGLTYYSTGGLCGPSGNTGNFDGSTELQRVGGGYLTYDL